MKRRILRNLRRATNVSPHKRPKCPVCRRRHEMVTGSGEAGFSTLADERHMTGVCSQRCREIYYGIQEGHCLCGEPVHVAGADCAMCQRARVENDTMVFKEAYVTRALVSTGVGDGIPTT